MTINMIDKEKLIIEGEELIKFLRTRNLNMVESQLVINKVSHFYNYQIMIQRLNENTN